MTYCNKIATMSSCYNATFEHNLLNWYASHGNYIPILTDSMSEFIFRVFESCNNNKKISQAAKAINENTNEKLSTFSCKQLAVRLQIDRLNFLSQAAIQG